ncbi:EF-hand domain and EF-hand domain pair-containing protein [Aphelenchoides bicaudatus]|nr:EF-hand domain and EF-hand domain pair-containing protein [Aphelenchoides bicaudatus]
MRGFKRRKALVETNKITFSLVDNDTAETDSLFILNKRVSLTELTRETHFSSNELKSLYRSFKNFVPSALLSRDTFRFIFGEFFRRGDVEHFADLVFSAINLSQTGFITFPEYVRSLSALCRGTLEERLDWVYRLYDPLRHQSVSWQNFLHLLTAVNDLVELGKRNNFTPEQNIKRAQEMFSKFNHNINEVVSKEQFIKICSADPTICDSISRLHSVLIFKS